MKRALDDDTRPDHLRLNGGRLVNNSRQFFRDRDGLPALWPSRFVDAGREAANGWLRCHTPGDTGGMGRRSSGRCCSTWSEQTSPPWGTAHVLKLTVNQARAMLKGLALDGYVYERLSHEHYDADREVPKLRGPPC